MPRKPRFKLFAEGGGDLFGWMTKEKTRQYTPKTAFRIPIKDLKIRRK